MLESRSVASKNSDIMPNIRHDSRAGHPGSVVRRGGTLLGWLMFDSSFAVFTALTRNE
jgi:hypothetical protein